MNRTDRLYAIVEELRAVAPQPRSVSWLARRFEVTPRTVERDISALQQTGAPIYAEPGRTGGYCLDKARTLPPVNFTAAEAVAIAVALDRLRATPFGPEAGAAMRKLVAAMQVDDAAAARELIGRIHVLGAELPQSPPPRPLTEAVATGRVLRIGYADKEGTVSSRDVEALGYVVRGVHWYLVGWCRLRDALRVFRVDRISSVATTADVPPPRPLRAADLDVDPARIRTLSL